MRTAGALSPSIKDTKGYELKGLDADGVATRYREWSFRRLKRLKWHINVSLTQTGAISDADPELLFVLESFEERNE